MNSAQKVSLTSLIVGLMFGAGLAISGMTDVTKVQNFLDPLGNWDITLAFVMIGALAVALPCFHFVLKKSKPKYDDKFHMPSATKVDKKLLIGAMLFGAGWAMVGICPGPAFASLSYGYWQTLVFIAAMFVGAHVSRKLLD
ncbi:MAG: YeeE/YedE family protein [Gammaproteobacteria bacterium]|nr:YeeE/YedE family protein [Gammaproteobacteria bacterium]